MTTTKTLRAKKRGEGMVSYLIVLGLVVLACFGAAELLGGSIKSVFGKADGKVKQVGQRIGG